MAFLIFAPSQISGANVCNLNIIRLALLFTFLAAGLSGSAQEYLLDVQYYGIENGLSQRDVECILQDRQGFIWLGTNYGLNRFDGYSFKWFTHEKHGLQSNTINHILQDDEGWLWLFYTTSLVLQTPQSIDLFNPVTEEVLSFEEKFGKNLPFNFKDISSFTAAPDGRLAFVTTQKKLILYSHDKGFEISDISVYPLLLSVFSKHNTIWGYASKSDPSLRDVIIEIDLHGKELKRYEHDFPFQYNYIADVDKDDRLWYISKYWYGGRYEGDQKGKIFNIDTGGSEKEFLLGNTALPPQAVNLDIPANANEYGFWMNPDKDNFWLHGRGSFQGFHPSSGWYQELSATYKGLAQPNTVYFDNRDRVWVGTEFGLYVIGLSKNPFQSIAHDRSGENRSAFRGITQDNHHTIWACIDNGHGWLARFKQKNNHYETEISEREKSGWGTGYKYGIFTDSKGFIWFGSGQDSLITKYNPVDGSIRLIHYSIPPKVEDRQVNIWSFFEDKDGQVWFGSDVGVVGYVSGNLSVATLPELEGVYLKGGCIYQFFEDSKNKIWVATDYGMFLLDPKRKTVSPFHPDGFSFLREGIFHIHEDADGSFWMGTKGLGLIHWHPETGTYQQYTKADGLSNNTIYAVYEDDSGNLWLPSDYGIIQFNKSTHRTRAYLEKDGIANQEFNRLSHYKGKDGKLYFGGLNGITAFYPKNVAGDSLRANVPLVLTGFEQFDGDKNQLTDKTAALRTSNTITLQPADRYFHLEFALLAYSDAGNMQYAYFIEGVDKDWTYQKGNSIRFSRLPYGRHVLHIKGQTSNGQWSENELAIHVVVLKPFYLQTWFLVTAIFSLLASIFIFYRWRISNLQQRHRELENTVADRTKEIVRDKQIIEQQAEELKSLEQLKSRFFANVSHELRTPLTLMLGPVHSLLKRMEKNSAEKKLLQFIERNARQLQKLINEILDLSKLEDNKMEVLEEPVHFYPYLKEQIAQFHSAAMSDELHFRLKFKADKSLQIMLDKGKFEKIIHNFLSNALKFTPRGGNITLSVEETGQQLLLSVTDSGRGIHPDDLPHLFDRFYQSRQADAPVEGGTGIGLSLVKELAELLGGSVRAESEPGKGSVFHFRFPKVEATSSSAGEVGVEEGVISTLPTTTDFFEMTPSILPTTQSSEEGTSKSTILLVEDNSDLREYLQLLLCDYQVITVENGQEALHFLNSADAQFIIHHSSFIIISDLMMPVMDGFQLLERLKTDDRWRHLPVIMLTAKVNIQAKLQALRIGVDDYLTKPFQEDELKARIDTLLRNYRGRMDFYAQNKNERAGTPEPDRPVIAAIDAEWLQEVEDLFKKHLSDSRLRVDFAAEQLHLSQRQFRRKLQQLTGISPNHYLQEIRLQTAKDLLFVGRYSTVKEVCFAVGYKDTAYFSSLFAERFGATASSYFR